MHVDPSKRLVRPFKPSRKLPNDRLKSISRLRQFCKINNITRIPRIFLNTFQSIIIIFCVSPCRFYSILYINIDLCSYSMNLPLVTFRYYLIGIWTREVDASLGLYRYDQKLWGMVISYEGSLSIWLRLIRTCFLFCSLWIRPRSVVFVVTIWRP